MQAQKHALADNTTDTTNATVVTLVAMITSMILIPAIELFD